MILMDISSGWESFVQLISVLLIFVFVLIITLVTTRWIARYQQGMMYNRNIQVIETLRVSNNKYIQIIKTGKKYLVISVCKDTICALTELSEDQLELSVVDGENTERVSKNFQEILDKLKDKFPRKQA